MKKKIFVIMFAFVFICVSVWLADKPSHEFSYKGPVDKLTIGTVSEYSTLVFIAQSQGFFRDNGLEVTTVGYTSGAPSLQALADGKVDVSIGSDFSGVSKRFETQDFKAVTAVFNSLEVFEFVTRKDLGIKSVHDLKGKKIGLIKKTMGEFFLGTYLTFNNLSLADITQVDAEPAELAKGLNDGSLDAIVVFQPYAYEVEKKLGDNALTLPVQGSQPLYALLFSNQKTISEKPDALKRLVKSLLEAEQFVKDNPEEVKTFFAKQFGYSEDYVSDVLSKFNFELSLSQSMLLAMEDEARWAIDNRLTSEKKVPNYLEFIYFDPLASVKSEAVTIIK